MQVIKLKPDELEIETEAVLTEEELEALAAKLDEIVTYATEDHC